LVEAVLFTLSVSVYLNPTDIVYEDSPATGAPAARQANNRAATGRICLFIAGGKRGKSIVSPWRKCGSTVLRTVGISRRRVRGSDEHAAYQLC